MHRERMELGLSCTLGLRLMCVAALFLALLAPVGSLSAGECVHAMDACEIVRVLSGIDPGDVPPDAALFLGCLSHGVRTIMFRANRGHLPTWRGLRNTRREYRDLGRDLEVVAVLEHICTSEDPRVRSSAAAALLLYGQSSYRDSLDIGDPPSVDQIMLLAFLGDSSGVELAIDSYPDSEERQKQVLLDALWYQSTPPAVEFIAGVARDSTDTPAVERARWMVENPMPVEASWKL